MKIETKFNIGDTVFIPKYEIFNRIPITTCPVCGGSGRSPRHPKYRCCAQFMSDDNPLRVNCRDGILHAVSEIYKPRRATVEAVSMLYSTDNELGMEYANDCRMPLNEISYHFSSLLACELESCTFATEEECQKFCESVNEENEKYIAEYLSNPEMFANEIDISE